MTTKSVKKTVIGLIINFLKNILFYVLKVLSLSLGSLYWLINGDFYKFDPILEAFNEEADLEENKKEERGITFLGYYVKEWTLISFAFILFIILLLIGDNRPEFIFEHLNILLNGLTLTLFPLVLLIIYNTVIPEVIIYIAKQANRISINLTGKY